MGPPKDGEKQSPFVFLGWVGLPSDGKHVFFLGVGGASRCGKGTPLLFFWRRVGLPIEGKHSPQFFFGGGRGWVRLASDGRKHTEVGGAAQRWEKHSPLCVFGVDARIELPIDGEKHPPFDFFGVGGAAH